MARKRKDGSVSPPASTSRKDAESPKPGNTKHAPSEDDKGVSPILNESSPLKSARAFLRAHYERRSFIVLACLHDEFYEWQRTHYVRVDENELRKKLYEFLDKARQRTEDGGTCPFNPTRAKVNNVLDAVRAVVHQPNALSIPFWLDGRTAPEPGEIVSCTNGLLHTCDGKLHEHTPHFFNLNSLGFAFDRDAPQPARWLLFLRELFGDDIESIECLQEVFGYCLTCATDQQKIILIIGPPRSGKGTIARVLSTMIGSSNVANPTLASLTQNFGLQSLIGKQLGLVGDARVGRRQDPHVVVERLLSISGEDCQTIDRKYKASWTGKLAIKFLILSNEFPSLPDASAALASRMIVFRLIKSFLGKENPQLTHALLTELPGILNWALEGLRRLQARGHFIQPTSSADLARDIEDVASPLGMFVRENCDVEAGRTVEIPRLYETYRRWCDDQGIDPETRPEFGRQLRAAVSTLSVAQERIGGDKRQRFYIGIGLKPIVSQDVTRVVRLNSKSE